MITGTTAQKVKRVFSPFLFYIKYSFKNAQMQLFKRVLSRFPDGSECPSDISPGHSYREESGFSTYRGSEDDGPEPSSPSGDYSGRQPIKPVPPRFQKQPQHHQQQVSTS